MEEDDRWRRIGWEVRRLVAHCIELIGEAYDVSASCTAGWRGVLQA